MPKVARGEMEKRKSGTHWNVEARQLVYGNGCAISPALPNIRPENTGCFTCPLPGCIYGLSPKKMSRIQLELAIK